MSQGQGPTEGAADAEATAFHSFADAALELAAAAKGMSTRLEAYEDRQAERAKASVRQIQGSLLMAVTVVIAVVIVGVALMGNQNRTASEQRANLNHILTVLVDCTTPTPPPTPADPHPRRHVCAEQGQVQQAIAIRQLQLGTLYAMDCSAGGKTDGALFACVNAKLAAAQLPPIEEN